MSLLVSKRSFNLKAQIFPAGTPRGSTSTTSKMADLLDAIEKMNEQTLYELLGCDELSTKEQINAEFKQRVKKLHPDKMAEDDEESRQHFERLCQARNILCDDQRRKEYDQWLRSGVKIPFDMWSKFRCSLHSSVHWAPQPPKKAMLDCVPEQKKISEAKGTPYSTDMNSRPNKRFGWRSKSSCRISKFRKYEI